MAVKNWNVADDLGIIHIPDYLDKLATSVGNNFGFVLHSGNVNQAVCDIVYKAETVFNVENTHYKEYRSEFGMASPVNPFVYSEEDEHAFYNWEAHFGDVKFFAPSIPEGRHRVEDVYFNGVELLLKNPK